MLPGIDVSHWEPGVDWQKVKQSGQKFAYTKASEGNTITDAELLTNVRGSAAAGIPIGAYHFYRQAATPEQNAEQYLNAIRGLELQLPPALDVEEETQAPVVEVAARLRKWLDIVQRETGRKPIIYTSYYYWKFTGQPNWSSEYDLWVAHYTSAPGPLLPKPWTTWRIWQYSDKGKIPGVTGDVDQNWFNGNEEDLNRWAGIKNPETQLDRIEKKLELLLERIK